MTKDAIQQILDSHARWLHDKDIHVEDSGKGTKADFSGANLTGVDLSERDLREINFHKTCLHFANLENARLDNANLNEAELPNANLRNTDMCNCKLSFANLRNARLQGARLRGADLSWANLCNADFRHTSGADAIICAEALGSANRKTTWNIPSDEVFCGCFRGSIELFEQVVEETHKNSPKYLAEYRALIVFFKAVRDARALRT